MIKTLIRDEAGFLISAELVLIFTLMFCGVAVGMGVIRDSLVQELGDVAEAIGALNQSYAFNTLEAPGSAASSGLHVHCSGSGFADQKDDRDCEGIEFEPILPKDDPNNTAAPGLAAEGQ
jgi:hypothetical protein